MLRDLLHRWTEMRRPSWLAIALVVLSSSVLDPVLGAALLVMVISLGWLLRRPYATGSLINGIIVTFLVIPGGLGVIAAAAEVASYFGRPGGGVFIQVALVYWVALAGAIIAAVRWPHEGRSFTLIAIAILGLVKLYYVWVFDVTAVSDFGSMLRHADTWAERGIPFAPAPSAVNAVHGERILLYLYPIRAVFGESDAYQFANVAVTLATALTSSWLARRFFGATSGRVALVLALFAVEPLQAAEIPTHDIPGALAILATLAIWVRLLGTTGQTAWGLSVLSGLGLVWVAMQRGVGSVLILTILILLALSTIGLLQRGGLRSRGAEGGAIRIAQVLLLPLAVYWMLSAGLTLAHLKRDVSSVTDRRAIAISSHSASWSNGSYGSWRKEWAPREVPAEGGTSFVMRRLLTDYRLSPWENLAHYFRKSARLYQFGSQQSFYLTDATLHGDRPLGDGRTRQFAHLNRVATVPLLGLMIGGLCLLIVRRERVTEEHLPVLMLSMISGILIVLHEVQPRYLFPIWYIGPVYAAYLFSRREGEVRGEA